MLLYSIGKFFRHSNSALAILKHPHGPTPCMCGVFNWPFPIQHYVVEFLRVHLYVTAMTHFALVLPCHRLCRYDPPSDFFAQLAMEMDCDADAGPADVDHDVEADRFFSVVHPLHERAPGVARPIPKALLSPEDLAAAAACRAQSAAREAEAARLDQRKSSRGWVAFADGPLRASLNPASSIATEHSMSSLSSTIRPLKNAPLRALSGLGRLSSSLGMQSSGKLRVSSAGSALGLPAAAVPLGMPQRIRASASGRGVAGDEDDDEDSEAAVLALLKEHNKKVTGQCGRTLGKSGSATRSSHGGLRKRPANGSSQSAQSPPKAKRPRPTHSRPMSSDPRPRRAPSSAEEAALQELLSQHNRKVTAAAASHDIHGRSVPRKGVGVGSSSSSSIGHGRPPLAHSTRVSRVRAGVGSLR